MGHRSAWDRLPAVIEETGPVYYVREPNGALIVRLDGQYTNYYHFDALGSTRLLTNASGTETDRYSYDAWGNVTHDSGSASQPYQYVGQLGYYTHVQDANLPLLQLGVRMYDPEIGRFGQSDPERAENNHFVYASGNPTTLRDPWGLKPCPTVDDAFECAKECTKNYKLPSYTKDTQKKVSAWCMAICLLWKSQGCDALFKFCMKKGRDTLFEKICMGVYLNKCFGE